jgi:hypothetical protein
VLRERKGEGRRRGGMDYIPSQVRTTLAIESRVGAVSREKGGSGRSQFSAHIFLTIYSTLSSHKWEGGQGERRRGRRRTFKLLLLLDEDVLGKGDDLRTQKRMRMVSSGSSLHGRFDALPPLDEEDKERERYAREEKERKKRTISLSPNLLNV